MPASIHHSRQGRLAGVYEALVAHPNDTVSSLMKRTRLSRPTITTLLDSLTELGLVAPQGAEGNVGRPAETWAPRKDAGVVIGVDLLHRSALLAVARLDGEIIDTDHRSEVSVDSSARFTTLLDLISSHITEGTAGPPLAIVVSTTGTVDLDGRLMRSDAVPQWEGFALGHELSQRLHLPVRIENDVNASAFGEFALRCGDGSLQPTDDLLLIALSRAIVTGLVMGGELHRGNRQNAGEVGLRIIDESGPASGNLARAAESIGTVSAVLDPACIVLSLPNRESPGILAEIIDHLRINRESSAAELNLQVSRLGQGAAIVGALSLALQEARTALFGESTRLIPIPKEIGHITRITARGIHSPMSMAQPAASERATLRIGVVGVGARADIAKHFELPRLNCRITAAADPHPDAEARLPQRLGRSDIKLTRNVTELIAEGIDAALVTSPDDTHAQVTCELLRAGIPVYVEKPLATRMNDAIEILRTAYETGTKLYVGHNMRHMDVVRSMRDLIRRGAIGEVKAIWCRHFVGNGGDYYFKDWHADRSRTTGLLLQKAAHDIDVMNWLSDSVPARVVAMGDLMVYGSLADRAPRPGQLMQDWFSFDNWPPESLTGLNPTIDVEDMSMLLMRQVSGAMVSYEQCHFTPDYWRNYTVIGTRGRAENFGDGQGGVVRVWTHRRGYDAKGDIEIPLRGDAGGHDDADVATMAEFLRFVLNGEPTDTTPLGAREAVAAGVLATRSLRNHNTPYDVPRVRPELAVYFEDNQRRATRSRGA